MPTEKQAVYQRNALAPSLLAGLILLIGIAAIGGGAFLLFQFLITILALIVGWFAIQAKQWWWAPAFLAVAVLWNPVFPITLPEQWWVGVHYVALLLFVLAGLLIKTPRATRS